MNALYWSALAQLLRDNLVLVLTTAAIPFLILIVFTAIRKNAGNAVTAMPDVLVYLFSVNFAFLLSPEPWKKMVHPSVRESFPILSGCFVLAALIVFCCVLPVERKMVTYHLKQMWPSMHQNLIPPGIKNQGFPYVGLGVSWLAISTFVAVNALVFVLR